MRPSDINLEKYIDIEASVSSMMQERVYPIIELVGSSPTSWEEAAKNAIKMASRSLWNLKIAEVNELDVKIDDQGNIIAYRTKLRFSLKYDDWKGKLGWKAPQE